jgi:signal transduction histidine kinase
MFRIKQPSLLAQFSLLSLALFIVIGAALGWGLTRHYEDQALEQQEIVSASLMAPAVAPYVTENVLQNGALPGSKEYKDIEYAFSFLGGAGLVIVKIWNEDGVLVYSDDPNDVGQKFPISEDLAAALDGRRVSRISPLDREENRDDRGYGELLEVYTPFYFSGATEPSGAFEGYYDVDDLRTQINQTSGFLWGSIVWGFLFLYVSLFAIVRGASQRLIKQSNENAILLVDTQRKATRLEALNELARSINESSLDLEKVFDTALRGIDRIVEHSGASLSLLDERSCRTERRVLSTSPAQAEVSLADLDIETEIKLLGDKEAVLCSDTRRSQEEPGGLALAERGVRSFLAISISLGDRRLGALLVVSKHANAFDEEDAATLKGVADQLAVAIENVRLIEETAETTALRETNRLKDEFVSMVSHELRTPLASIKGYSRTLLADDGWDDDTREEFLSIIAEESDKLTDLVENLLEMSRIGAGRLPITPEPVLLSRFCKGVIDRLAKQYPDIQFNCDMSDPLPVVEADPRRLEQVLANLLQNAAKYSGSPTISVGGSYNGEREVVMWVKDWGKGIGPEHSEHLFDKFYRIEDGSKSTGSGLGLAICKALVEAQGGRIWMESRPGYGTTFFFTLPVLTLDGEGNEPGKESSERMPAGLSSS